MSEKDKIKEGLQKEGFDSVKEVEGKEKFNYVIPAFEKMYAEINPRQVTLKNNIIYLNSTEDRNDNAYMFQCQDLYRNASATHSACINLRHDLTVANGLEPVNEDPATQEFLDRVNRVGDTWQDIWEKICFDQQLHGMFSLQLLYNREQEIPEVIHIDISNVRAISNKENEEFVPYIDTWALSNKWADISTKNRYTPNNSAASIANFNPNSYKEDGYRQLLVHRDYQSGNFPYGLPHYNSVLKYIQLDNELSKFHLNKVSGGFFPNVIVKLAGNPSEEEKDEFVRNFKRKYLGTDNEKVMFIWNEGEDVEPEIIPFSTNDDNQIFEILDRVTTQKILTANQIMPELASLPSEGQSLGGDANKINVSRQYTIETVIKPIQKSMLKTINKIFKHNGLSSVTVTNEALKLNEQENKNNNDNAPETN